LEVECVAAGDDVTGVVPAADSPVTFVSAMVVVVVPVVIVKVAVVAVAAIVVLVMVVDAIPQLAPLKWFTHLQEQLPVTP
jgi:hypothetical protein